MAVEGLALYHFLGCPFCRRVRDALTRLDLDLEERDIHDDPRWGRELLEATGRLTVPCLRIEEAGESVRWLHESADIVDYLESRFRRGGERA